MPTILVLHMKILTLVLIPCSSSHTNPCASPGYQRFTLKSLCLSRILAVHRKILMPVHVPNNSNSSLHGGRLLTIPTIPDACTGSQQFKQLLVLVHIPNHSNSSSLRCRMMTLNMQILTLVQLCDN
ncbi:hypothetical protein O181_044336 [Austropuccinia psidii MF-1]|uniref:Secreted protein n=1 Tax=Austropuccinia psidii MF-1 TaxID=1389203 RepID=A0A9Q3DQ74_9BASI|nr:hypothetical protein [Austropuccinia psidii MF-1]